MGTNYIAVNASKEMEIESCWERDGEER